MARKNVKRFTVAGSNYAQLRAARKRKEDDSTLRRLLTAAVMLMVVVSMMFAIKEWAAGSYVEVRDSLTYGSQVYIDGVLCEGCEVPKLYDSRREVE